MLRKNGNVFVVISTTAIVAVLLLPWLNLKGQEGLDHAQRMAKMAGSWVTILAVARLSWELPWVLFHRYIMGAAGAGKLWSYLWWTYALGGDARYPAPSHRPVPAPPGGGDGSEDGLASGRVPRRGTVAHREGARHRRPAPAAGQPGEGTPGCGQRVMLREGSVMGGWSRVPQHFPPAT